MKKTIVHLIFLLIFSFSVFAQTDEGVSFKTAPVKWESYKISGRDITLNFPKLPVKRIGIDTCNNIESETFGAYANQRADIFTLFTKSKEKIPNYCSSKNLFSKQSFLKRKNEFDENYTKISITEKVSVSDEIYKYSNENVVIWLVNDHENNSWYEFSVIGAADSDAFNNFINTLERKSNKSAIEIRNGASATIGDEGFLVLNSQTSSMQIYFKPKANYTELARINQTQGTVTLMVFFYANGAIGSIKVVSGLPDGLTEEAISAARSLIFRPAMKDGKSVTIARQVQYTFTLY